MKRSLVILPFILLILINACGNNVTTEIPKEVGTHVAETQTAFIWTPTISPTPRPNTAKMVDWINGQLTSADELEQIIEANYKVVDVTFPTDGNGIITNLRVAVRCDCAGNNQCCIPERMFVKVILGLKIMEKKDNFIAQVPETVSELDVVCYNRASEVGTMAVSWPDIKSYLNGEINGTQLGARVWRK